MVCFILSVASLLSDHVIKHHFVISYNTKIHFKDSPLTPK